MIFPKRLVHLPIVRLTKCYFSKTFAGICGFWRDESGPTTVEYGVMLALILLVCITAIQAVGGQVSSSYNARRRN